MYNDKELDAYDTYLKVVKSRIVELNNKTTSQNGKRPPLLIYMVDIDHISKKTNGEWEFTYTIEGTPKINGWIRHLDFNHWLSEKKMNERDEKLKLLGI
jgi:hypothetical protein